MRVFGNHQLNLNIRVNGVNACGPSAAYAVVSVRQSTGVPATITGDAFACGGDTKTYSHAAVTGATSYQWTAAAGCYFDGNPINTPPYVTTNTSVNVTFHGGYTTGVVGVASQVACFTSAYKTLRLTTLLRFRV
ncbi:MAG: hypothetical protein IPJ79_02060 [Bacteroidetes bacterium]|nr:hypothetical protein [Bacteroidota bacterium]